MIGHTLAQIRDSLGPNGATLAGRAPGVVSFLGGTNNLNDTLSDGQLTSYLDEILGLLLASSASLLVVWGIPPARPSSPRTANAERQRRLMNAYLAGQVAANAARAVFVDPDGLGLTNADYLDQVHPTASGARKLGLAGASAVAPRLAAGLPTTIAAPEVYTANPTLMGGTDVATGWSASVGQAGGATVAFSKDGQGRQRILVAGTYAGTGRNVSLDQYANVASIGAAPPENAGLEALLDYELVGAPVGINALDALLGVGTSGYANLAQAQSMLADDAAPLFPIAPGRTVLRSIGVLRKAGAPYFLTTRLIIAFSAAATASPISLDLRVNRLEFRRAD